MQCSHHHDTDMGQKPAAEEPAPRVRGRRRGRPSWSSRLPATAPKATVALLLAVAGLLLLLPGRALALSPSKLIASFASQQRRAGGGGFHGGCSAAMAAAMRHGPHAPAGGGARGPVVPPKGSSPSHRRRGSSTGAGAAGGLVPSSKAAVPAFVRGGGGDGGEFAASWGPAREWSREVSNNFYQAVGPREMAGSMGISGLTGMAAGYVAKRFGRLLSFGVGFVLVSMRVAEEFDYISVNWDKIERDTRSLGQSLWGKEGKVRRKAERLASTWQREYGLGMAGTFAAGFAYGFRA